MFILIYKVFDWVAVHSKIKIDNKGIEEWDDTFKDAISQVILIALGEKLFHSIFTKSFILGKIMEVIYQVWVLSVKDEIFHSVLDLSMLGFILSNSSMSILSIKLRCKISILLFICCILILIYSVCLVRDLFFYCNSRLISWTWNLINILSNSLSVLHHWILFWVRCSHRIWTGNRCLFYLRQHGSFLCI